MKVSQDNHKLLYHKERIRQWLSEDGCQPITAEVSPSLICNHKCPQCTFHNQIRKQFIPWQILERLAAELASVGTKGVIVTGGGEPLTNADTYRFIELLDGRGIDVTLTTNGSLLGKDMKSLLSHCRRIRISLDAASPEAYAQTHGMPEGHFKLVLDNLRTAVRMKREARLSTDLGVSFLVSRNSKADILPAMALFKDIGVNFIQFKPMQIRGENQWYYEDIGPLQEYVDKKRAFETETYKISFFRHKYFEGQQYERRYSHCHGACFDLVISTDAKVYLCCHLQYDPAHCLGDLKSESLADIIQRIRASSQVTKDCIPFCRLDAINELLDDLSKNPGAAVTTLNDFKDNDALDKNWL